MLSVHTHENENPQDDLDFEETVIDLAADGNPQLFFYSWSSPTLVLGYGQRHTETLEQAAKTRGIPVFRRRTGGTGVLQNGDLNISLALEKNHPYSAGIHTLYKHFLFAITKGLQRVGIPTLLSEGAVKKAAQRSHICFEDHAVETLLVDGKKVVGCAQARRRGAALVHGTLMLNIDTQLQAEIFGVPRSRIDTSIGAIPILPGLTKQQIAQAIADEMTQLIKGETT